MSSIQDDDLAGLCHVPGKAHAACAENAAFLVQLDERSKILCFLATGFSGPRIPARVAGIGHVVVLEPAFTGLIAYRAIDRMMEEKELHGIADGLLDTRGGRPNDHAVGDG